MWYCIAAQPPVNTVDAVFSTSDVARWTQAKWKHVDAASQTARNMWTRQAGVLRLTLAIL
jgi:hypothetical protein